MMCNICSKKMQASRIAPFCIHCANLLRNEPLMLTRVNNDNVLYCFRGEWYVSHYSSSAYVLLLSNVGRTYEQAVSISESVPNQGMLKAKLRRANKSLDCLVKISGDALDDGFVYRHSVTLRREISEIEKKLVRLRSLSSDVKEALLRA